MFARGSAVKETGRESISTSQEQVLLYNFFKLTIVNEIKNPIDNYELFLYFVIFTRLHQQKMFQVARKQGRILQNLMTRVKMSSMKKHSPK